MAPLLVGREREVRVIREALTAAAGGRGELVHLAGEPGIGKTRLAEVAGDLAAAAGFETFWGRCWEEGGAPAFWPWRPLLAALGIDPAREPARADDADDARLALFERVRAQLALRAERRPVLLLLDDLHAADRGSLLLLAFLARTVHQARVVVVAAHREVDARLRQPAAELLPGIARSGVHLPLSPLAETDVRALTEGLGFALDAARLADLMHVTGGRPLFVEHTLRSLATSDHIELPHTLQAIFRDRLGLMAEETRALLGLLAVAESADEAVLAAANGTSIAQVRASLEPARTAGLLRQEPQGGLAVGHALLRAAILGGLGQELRTRHHARLALALEPLEGRHGEVARHALAAHAHLGTDRAVSAVVQATERHLRSLAPELAVELCEEAVLQLERALTPGALSELLLARGRARLAEGRYAEGKEDCLRAAALSRRAGRIEGVARAALTLGAEHRPAMIDPDLVALLRESHQALDGADALGVEVLARLAAALQPAPDPSVPVAMAREAVARSRRLASADRRKVLFSALSALADRGDVAERIALHDELLADTTDRMQALRTHARLVMDHMEAGQIRMADLHLALYSAMVEEVRAPRLRWPLRGLVAMRALYDGRFEEVDAIHEELGAALARSGDRALRGVLLSQRFMRLVRGGRPDEALPLLERVPTGPTTNLVLPAWRAIAHLARGDLDRVRTEVHLLQAMEPPLEDPVVARLLGEAIAAAGRPEERRRVRATLLPRERGLVSFGLVTMVVDGPVRRLLDLLDAALGGAARPAAPSRPTVALELAGDFVRVRSSAGEALLKRSRGHEILRRLLDEPGRELHVLPLMGAAEEVVNRPLEVLDPRALASYRGRVEDLREQIGEAEDFGDHARAAIAREELELLTEEIGRAVGLGGRSRGAGSDVERARVSVQRHLKKAIRAIGEPLPEVGRYLERCVVTGTWCRFEPL